MTINRSRVEIVVLVGLIVTEAISVYQTLFCLWMLAHPVYASPEWAKRLEIRLMTTLVIGARRLLSLYDLCLVSRGSRIADACVSQV